MAALRLAVLARQRNTGCAELNRIIRVNSAHPTLPWPNWRLGSGVVALGFDRQAIEYRLEVGRLHLLQRGCTRGHRDQHLVIELDNRQFHSTPRAFEQVRDRDADLLNAGFSTLRITDRRLKEHDVKEAQRLRDILQCRSGYAAAAFAANCPHAASMSRPRVSRTVARNPCSSSAVLKASIAPRLEPS